MKPTKCPAKEKKWGKESEKIREERKRKVKVKTAVSLLNPKTDWCVILGGDTHLKLPKGDQIWLCDELWPLKGDTTLMSF